MINYKKGQRWISEMEPELGLGLITKVDRRMVNIQFPASQCERIYAVSSAPLKRVEFKSGDTIQSKNGTALEVISVSEVDSIFIYHGSKDKIPENELSDSISFTTPVDRLMNGLTDTVKDFNLRSKTQNYQYNTSKSTVRGFVGGRISLIPHQLYVAKTVAASPAPRVLLSDETGLGKTIEVCLILHRLLINEQISRVMLLLPDTLVHQWFVELIRKFNLVFRIIDKEYCESAISSNPETNPFLEDQLAICSIEFLSENPQWEKKAVEAGWDMLVIDEAHHLKINSPSYRLADELSKASAGLLLLTATPEQLGHDSHFARLQLLDPSRYHAFDLFEKEENQYLKISAIINKLIEHNELDKTDVSQLAAVTTETNRHLLIQDPVLLDKDKEFRKSLINDILDRFGTGRAVFRNTRSAMKGFPDRKANLVPLKPSDELLQQQTSEFLAGLQGAKNIYHYKNDPRLEWLVNLLKKLKTQKVLLICQSIEKVKAIEEILRKSIKTKITLFHEDMTLIQRDRNASWFAELSGAQILLCSEIGSEGRNFQFAHHLVLFDLPLDPELLEQRIGRLDRIGQTDDIQIHIPFIEGSEYGILANWYHQGLNAFNENVSGSYQIFQKMKQSVLDVIFAKDFSKLKTCIKETRKLKKEINKKLKMGRDRLLELNSFNMESSKKLVKDIRTLDKIPDLKNFMFSVFEMYGIQEEQISTHVFRLNISQLSTPDFPLPLVKREDIVITFDRETALNHGNIEFINQDHPMVSGIFDILLGSEKGNSCLASFPKMDIQEFLLELIFVLETVAPKELYINRFLPPTPIRIVLNHAFQDRTKTYSVEFMEKNLMSRSDMEILENVKIKQELFPAMISKGQNMAQKKSDIIIRDASKSVEGILLQEVQRLTELKKVNKNIKQEEITGLKNQIDILKKSIRASRLRLDALRFIIPGE